MAGMAHNISHLTDIVNSHHRNEARDVQQLIGANAYTHKVYIADMHNLIGKFNTILESLRIVHETLVLSQTDSL